MPPDPPRGSALRASLLPLRGKAFSHSTPTKKLGIYVGTLLELYKLAFERMLQEELSVKVVLKSSL